MSTETLQQQICQRSKAMGIPCSISLALVESESNFNPLAIGDNGCSYGLFQLNTCAGQPGGLDIPGQIQQGLQKLRNALQQAGGDVVNAFAIYKGGTKYLTPQAQNEAQRAYALMPKYSLWDFMGGGYTSADVPPQPQFGAGRTPLLASSMLPLSLSAIAGEGLKGALSAQILLILGGLIFLVALFMAVKK